MWRILLPIVFVPTLAVIVMTLVKLLERPERTQGGWDIMTTIGWDLCVLGVGITGSIFADKDMQTLWGPAAAFYAAIITILIDIGMVSAISFMRKMHNPATIVVGNIALGLGIFAVALPSALTFWR